MGIISIIIGIIAAIPQMISIVMSIIKLIKQLRPTERGAAMLALQVAADKYATTKDASGLTDLHDQLLAGTVGTPPSTK